ncbi:hypothetical protein RFI_28874 [Reticulomyxa filosa]|uniref:Uncharacterized protein n=1 Tax=Reticulomyxa filosa TaxID=46433 RepID=X6M651_RETFI|nr:hypothetical protein RFI_28874 [Reticulomyxa filosa]|eukprot:ETO08510.1 hypothetical protein RFI_28874 [Reticulomyxa filosa]
MKGRPLRQSKKQKQKMEFDLMALLSFEPPFSHMNNLPATFTQAPCVVHKHEILICGDARKRECYSFHTQKNRYEFVCSYPEDVKLEGRCVVKRVNKNNSDDITLLSFSGMHEHALVMKYVSVWNDDDDNGNGDGNKKNKNDENDNKDENNNKAENDKNDDDNANANKKKRKGQRKSNNPNNSNNPKKLKK